MSLLEALDEWAAHLNVASEIAVEKSNSFGFSVSISNTQRKKSDIMNVGIGTSQVLPVLITGLLSEPEEYFFLNSRNCTCTHILKADWRISLWS